MRHPLKPESSLNVLRHSAYYGFGIVLSFSCIITPSILTTLCRKFYHYPHFSYGKMRYIVTLIQGSSDSHLGVTKETFGESRLSEYTPLHMHMWKSAQSKPRWTEPRLRRHKSKSLSKLINRSKYKLPSTITQFQLLEMWRYQLLA